jgi:putative ABC transport system substrate-binding protein
LSNVRAKEVGRNDPSHTHRPAGRVASRELGAAQGLVVFAGVLITAEAARIAKLALDQRLPLVGPGILTDVASGALLRYGAAGSALARRAAYYVDRILKGTKPGDLPIEQPMTFEMVVNLKTAKALGLTMPPEIMVQATQVIQ